MKPWSAILVLAALAFPSTAAQAACGYIPSAYAVYGAANLQLDNHVKVNGSLLTPQDYNGNERDGLEPDGDVVDVDSVNPTYALPTPDPAAFPAFSSSSDRTNPGTLAAGTYRTVSINNSGSHLLSGGTYYIKTLNVSKPKRGSPSTLTLNSGDYFVENLIVGSTNLLKVNGTARIYIKTKFNAAGSSQVNFGGAIGGLQVYLLGNAQFITGNNARFAGVVLGSDAGGKIDLRQKAGLRGAFLTAGTVISSANKSTRAINLAYDAADQAAVAGVSTCASTPIVALARWTLDQDAWTGVAGEVQDSSGNAYHGTAANGLTTESVNPVVAGSPGTCRYGQFDGVDDHAELAGLPNYSTSFTATAWINPATTAGRRPILLDDRNDGGWSLSLGDSGSPWLRFLGRGVVPEALDSGYSLVAGNWYFVAASVDTVNKSRAIHVFDTAGNLLNSTTDATPYTGAWGSDPGVASIGGELDAAAGTEHFQGSLDEVAIYQGVLNTGQLRQILAETRSCISLSVPGAFNIFDATTEEDAIEGVITTKVAGNAFALDVVAVNEDGDDVETGFTGAVGVQLLNAADNSGALDAGNCRASWTLLADLGSLTFAGADQGRKRLAGINVAGAYRNLRVKATHGASGNYGCATDAFAVRPDHLAGLADGDAAVLASDADWKTAGTARTLNNTGATGGVIHKAGRPFTVRAKAYNAAGAVTTGYDGSPSLTLASCLLPATGCVDGTFSSSGWSASDGQVASSALTYSEVGAVSAKLADAGFAGVDANDGSSAAQRSVESASFSIGRFVPDYLDTGANTPEFQTACGSFTYLGQPFDYATAPELTVTAKNAAGTTTVNYAGSLFKLTAASVTDQAYTAASGAPEAVAGALPAPGVSDLGAGVGRITFSVGDAAAGGGLRFARGNAPQAPFDAELALSFSLADSESIAPTSNPVSVGAATAGDGIAFDAGKQLRFGRLRLANATGTELRALPVPLTAQYWNGQGYVRNGDDNCTSLPALGSVALASPLEIGLTFYPLTADNQLQAGQTTASLANPLVAGNAGLVLSTPGAGHHGFLDLVVDAPAWLEFNWDGVDQGNDGNLLDDNPRARAAFGKRRGSDRVIIRREIY